MSPVFWEHIAQALATALLLVLGEVGRRKYVRHRDSVRPPKDDNPQ